MHELAIAGRRPAGDRPHRCRGRRVNGLILAPALFVTGFGTVTISPNVTLTLSEVDPRYAGSAGGMLQTAQRVGSAVGVALVLAQFFAQLT